MREKERESEGERDQITVTTAASASVAVVVVPYFNVLLKYKVDYCSVVGHLKGLAVSGHIVKYPKDS